ncbi:MAG: BlaI/MecI/CopY family transcriptional regulator [Acidibacillus sp.]|nr:BlaI/MecI/CopY family transcriptional regulator [Acidibacillus sp.]
MKSGELRQRVLWIVREFGPCGAPYVCDKVRDDHEISQNAVQTVLNRLVAEGLLVRSGTRRHYHYEACPTAEVAKGIAEQAAVDLLSQSGQIGLVHFVEAVDRLHPDSIDQLERILEERRTRRERT